MEEKLKLVLGAITLIGVGLAIGAILVIILMSSGVLILDKVSVGPVDFVVPTSQPFTSAVQILIPTSTTEPQGLDIQSSTIEPQGPYIQLLDTIRIYGNSNAGVQIEIPKTGIYRFSYQSGAYSTYADGSSPADTKTWLTSVLVFRGDKALWDGRRIKDESIILRLADKNYFDSAESAEGAAQGQYVEAQFNKGDVLTLIAVDHFDAYADNFGQVIVEWLYVEY